MYHSKQSYSMYAHLLIKATNPTRYQSNLLRGFREVHAVVYKMSVNVITCCIKHGPSPLYLYKI